MHTGHTLFSLHALIFLRMLRENSRRFHKIEINVSYVVQTQVTQCHEVYLQPVALQNVKIGKIQAPD